MAKYIDADLLRKEIDNVEEEARKVRVSGTDKEAIGADGKVKLCLELKAIINSLQQEEPEKPIPNDLEEAANEFANQDCVTFISRKKGFIAGAKWQAEQDKETIELAEDHAYLAGAVNEREQMLKDAVEGEVVSTSDNGWECIRIYKKLHKCDDKVKLIIIKED